jgi:hypothetical protein
MKVTHKEDCMDKDADRQVDISKLIAKHYGQLTKSEKRIADYLQQNQDEVAFLSAAEMAETLRLSEATDSIATQPCEKSCRQSSEIL